MPEETVVTEELSMEAQLAELEKSIKAEEETPATEEQPKAEDKPEVKPEPTLDDQLKEIEEPQVEPKVEQPTLNDDQKAILSLVPDKATAENLSHVAQSYHNFTSTLEKGDYNQTIEMLQKWNPKVVDGLLEHIYSQKIEEWTDRWIEEQQNPAHKHIRSLATSTEQRIAQLEEQLAAERQAKVATSQKESQAATQQAYDNHKAELFNKIKFSEADRPFVEAVIDRKVAKDPAVQAAIMKGQLNAVNTIFKAAVREYVERDKAATTAKEKVLDKQAAKVAPVQASPLAESVAITDEQVRSAPREKRGDLREAQQEAQLKSFFSSLTKRK